MNTPFTSTNRSHRQRSASTALLLAAMGWVASSATDASAQKVNYQDNALPIFRNSCTGCHNPEKKKAGLDLSTWQTALNGSNNGQVINPGDPDGSLLYRVMTHAEEPTMPPKKDKLPDKDLDVIKAWILAGAPETANGAAVVSKKPKVDLTFTAAAGKKPAGPPPMPHDLILEPIVHPSRPGAIFALAAAPWSPVVAVGSQHQVLLYNPETLGLLGVIPFLDGQPQVLKFNSNGQLLLIGGGQAAKSGKVILWDIVSGSRVTEVGDEFDAVLAADLSADQTRVALGGPSKVLKVFSTKDGQLIDAIKRHTDWVTAVQYSPDGVLLASGDRAGGLWVWEAKNNREFFNLAGHKSAITSVAWRGDSNILASASEDGTIKLWDMNSGKEVKGWPAHAGGVLSIDFARDGRLVSCGRDRVVKEWKSNGELIRQSEPFADIALKATFDHDGARIIAGDWSGTIRVFSTIDGKPVGDLSANPAPLADRLAVAEKHVPELQAPVDQAAQALTAAQNALSQANAELAKTQAAVPAAKARVEQLTTQLNSLKAAEQAAIVADAAAKSLTDQRKADVVRLTQGVADAQKALDAAGNEQRQLAADLDAHQKVQQAAQQSSDAALAAAAREPANAALATAATAAKADLDKRNTELADAQKTLAAKVDQVKALTDQGAKLKTDRVAADPALAAATENYQAKEKQKSDASAPVIAATTELAKASAEVPVLEKQVAPATEQQKNAAAAVARATQVAGAANAAQASARLEVSRLKVGQFFLGVYAARKELADKQAVADQATQQATAAQAAVDKANADLANLEKVFAEGPNRMKATEDAIDKSRQALVDATAAVANAQAAVLQKEALIAQASDLATKINAQAAAAPDNKNLADAVARARTSVDALNADATVARQAIVTKQQAMKAANDQIAIAEAAMVKEKQNLDAMPRQMDAIKTAIASAQADVAPKKAIVDQAAQAVAAAKAHTDELNAQYQKMSQEAGLGSAPMPPGKT